MKRRNFLKSILALPIFGKAVAAVPAEKALPPAYLAGPGAAKVVAPVTIIYGCGIDLSGTTWTAADVNSSGFGFNIPQGAVIESVKLETTYRTD